MAAKRDQAKAKRGGGGTTSRPGRIRPTAAAGDPPARPKAPRRPIPVHALADDRVHLAPPQLGRLRQGYLKTLCGLQAVSALSPFALADNSRKRCRTCFGKVDKDGQVAG